MLGIIFWFIILVIILSSVSKKNKGGGQKMANKARVNPQSPPVRNQPIRNQSVQNQPMRNQPVQNQSSGTSYESQQQLKERLAKKYNRTTEPDILQRAKESVQEDFSDSESQKNKQKELEKRVAEKLAEQKADTEREQEDVLYTVKELMVKGPNTELPFERDFLAEGIDMLNRIQA